MMRFWPVKFRTIVLLAVLGIGGWQTHQYLTGTEDRLVAIDTKTGEILWNRPLSKQSPRSGINGYYPLIPLSSDRLLLTDYLQVNDFTNFWKHGKPDRKTVCYWNELDQQTGRIIWRKSLKGIGLDGCPATYENGVVQDQQLYTFWEGRLWDDPEDKEDEDRELQQAIVAMDFKNHQIRWISPLQSQQIPMKHQSALARIDGNVLVIRSNQIVAGTRFIDPAKPISAVLKGLNIINGSVLWQQKLNDYERSYFGYDASLIASHFTNSSPGRNLQIVRSHNLDTGKLEASSQAVNIHDLFQHKGNIYTGIVENSIQKFVPQPGKHILDSPPVKIPLQPRSCIKKTIYPAQNHLIGLCEVNRVIYSDPESYQLFALDDQTGEQRWKLHITSNSGLLDFRPNGHMWFKMAVDAAGQQLFMPTVLQDAKSRQMIDHIQSIQLNEGKQAWRLPIRMLGQPIVSGDRLFVIAHLPRWQTLPMTYPKPLKP
jgi:hypothetical protein